VLTARVHGADVPAAKPLGPAIEAVALLRRLDRDDLPPYQGGADGAGGAVDAVAFRHAVIVRGPQIG
jgi:hypothetical protein